MKKANNIIQLSMQILCLLMMFTPLLIRIEKNVSMALFSLIKSLLTTERLHISYSPISALGLSKVLDFLTILIIVFAFVSVFTLILRLLNKSIKNDSLICMICSICQATLLSVYGLITTCTITTTLDKGNAPYYLKALLGKDAFKYLSNYVGSDFDTALSSLYGQTHYDYWGFFQVNSMYYIALALFIAMSCIAVYFHRQSNEVII